MVDSNSGSIRILVTGAGGQLGQELVLLDVPGIEMIGVGRLELDITDSEQCVEVISRLAPDVIIHAAAYTAVDQVETEESAAWLVNAEGTRHVAMAAEAIGAKLCYISTDYVFDGSSRVPYREDAQTDPRTAYGRTKLEGEKLAQAVCSRTFIVRTSWVYGRYGSNFVSTMLRLAQQQPQLKVVDDQLGSPTYTLDLASLLVELVQTEKYGIYHASNSGTCSWYDFACAIFEEAKLENKPIVIPCRTEEFPRPAPRPAYSVLGHEALVREGFQPLRQWREALKEYLQKP